MTGGGVQLDLSNLSAVQKGQRVIIKKAINRAAKPIRWRVIANAYGIMRYGFLAKSIRNKSKVYDKTRHVLIIGPSMSFSRSLGQYQKGERKGQPKRAVPFLYALILSSERSGKRYRPWLKDAFDSAGGQYLRTVGAEIGRDLQAAMK